MKGRSSLGHSDTVNLFSRIPMIEPSGFIEFKETYRIANETEVK